MIGEIEMRREHEASRIDAAGLRLVCEGCRQPGRLRR